MNPVDGGWCLYPWFEEHGSEYIHPDDIDAFRTLMPNGKLFKWIGTDNDFVVLEHASKQYRVKPTLAKPVPKPVYDFGEAVRVRSGNENKPATIRDIMWHFQKNEPFFYLDFEGKKSSRRYWTHEIQARDV